MIQDELLIIINMYNSEGYYKYGNIPPNKLQNAAQNYPVDPSDTPLALIDSTVMGSAKNGMVIGLKGVYFKNDWTTKTEKNFISWNELSNSHAPIGNGAMNCVQLIPGCPINMSGSSMSKGLLINLLNQIISLYKEISNSKLHEPRQNEQKNNSQNTSLIENQSNVVESDFYSEIVPQILALCMTADGNIEDSEVELATAIIENDELIQDKQTALESLSSNIDIFIANKNQSNAIYKLKATTIISKVSKITDENQKERLEVILEGMLESVGTDGASETKNIIDSIRKKL